MKARFQSLILIGILATSAVSAQDCGDWYAELVAIDGVVEIRRADADEWRPASLKDRICIGDSIRSGAFSQAAIALPGSVNAQLDESTTLTFAAPEDDRRTWLEILSGLIHIISRDPRALHVTTPFVNAGLEGTEFAVRVTGGEAQVDVYEGKIVLENDNGTVSVLPGQSATASAGRLDQPHEFAQADRRWARYYPLIIDGELPAADAPIPDSDRPRFFVMRAQRRLQLGRVASATDDLNATLRDDQTNSAARAMLAIIEISDGDLAKATDLIEQALNDDAASVPALIAQADLDLARFDLNAALEHLETARGIEPNNAIVLARFADIQIALGDAKAGLATAESAAAIDPSSSAAFSAKGFSALAAGDLSSAISAFEQAIALDSSAPLPRLGLGLALIRQGERLAGRQQIEAAVVLDVDNAVLRSYMGKAYFDEQRSALAETLLEIAKQLNPDDPTAWFYSALGKQAANEPVAALRDLAVAERLNGDRIVARSSLHQDEDLGARSAGVAQIYGVLGYEELAIDRGWFSTVVEPAEYSGHRLLADLYSTRRRHQLSRVSEFLQGQLLQPLAVTPIAPQLADPNLFILDSVGPSEIAFEDLNPVFPASGWGIQGAGVVGGNETRGGDVVLFGLGDRIAFNLGHFDYETDGFRENNDLAHEVTSAFVQFRASDRLSLQAELRSVSVDKGDLLLRFDSSRFDPVLRQQEEADSLRVALAGRVGGRSTLLASFVAQDAVSAIDSQPAFVGQLDRDSSLVDLQHIYEGKRWNVVSGLRSLDGDERAESAATIPLPFPPFEEVVESNDVRDVGLTSVYSYAHRAFDSGFVVSAGASIDNLVKVGRDERRFNPKLGFRWRAENGLTVRAAAFRTLLGPQFSKQIVEPRLEPTHVVGFSQFFYGPEGEIAESFSLGLSRELSAALYLGAEHSVRDLEIPVVFPETPAGPAREIMFPLDEAATRAYLYFSPSDRIALGAEYEFWHFDNHGLALGDGVEESKTRRIPLSVRYFGPKGLSFGLTGSYVAQSGSFASTPAMATPGAGEPGVGTPGSDRFWVVDASLAFRLPGRRGRIELAIKNLFDTQFQFQDIDPENPRIFPERFAALRFSLSQW